MIFLKRPLYPGLKSILSNGVLFPLYNMKPSQRKPNLFESVLFGNHKGTIRSTYHTKSKFKYEVGHELGITI